MYMDGTSSALMLGDLRVLHVTYASQELKTHCGLAVASMIRASAPEHFSGKGHTQSHLRDELVRRYGPPAEGHFSLRLPHISWLLHPIQCDWVAHDTPPQVSFKSIKVEIDNGRPVLIHLVQRPKNEEPLSVSRGNEQRQEAFPFGHVVLLVGYQHGDAVDPSLVVLDPVPEAEWVGAKQDSHRWPGGRLITYGRLTSGVSIVEGTHVEPNEFTWSTTGLLRETVLL